MKSIIFKQAIFLKILHFNILGLSLLCLTSCSFLSPVKIKPPTTYLLTSLPCRMHAKHPRPITLLVMNPETISLYNTTNMAYTMKPYQIAFYNKHQWAVSPTDMLQPLIVEALENTHYFRAIVNQSFSGIYQYALATQILTLTQDYTCSMPVVRLSVRAQLTKIPGNRLVATKEFKIVVPIFRRDPYSGVFAANKATQAFLGALNKFCIKHSK